MPAELQYGNWWHDRTEGIGLATALDARPVYQTTTPHHRIEVLAHDGLGWVLAVDGVLQGVERDPIEREMLIHVPLLGRRREECRVLLFGGDGLNLHEVLRHAFVTEVALCEPDRALTEVGSQYLGFGNDLRDPRVTVHELSPMEGQFDVIVGAVDQPHHLLTPDGVCVDSDHVVLGLTERRWYRNASPRDGAQHYYTVSQLAPGGFTGFFLHSRDGHSYAEPQHEFRGVCYNPCLHRAAFALPSFFDDLIPGGRP